MRVLVLCFGIAICGSAIAIEPFSPIERSVSTSRQFFVYGVNAQLRGTIADAAEQVKANTLAIMGQPDNWKTPIVINLQFPQANIPDVPDAALYFSQTGAGLKLQLDLVITGDLRAPRIQRELLRAILLERMYRNQPDLAVGTVYVQPPDWLLDGLLAAAPGQDRRALAETVSPMLANPASLENFLRQHADLLDAPARELYRAGSLALVQLLLDAGDGTPRLVHSIDSLPGSPNDPVAALQSEFRQARVDDLDKAWQAKLHDLAGPLRYELLSFAESERRLAATLQIKIPSKASEKSVRLEDLAGTKLSAAQKKALILAGENLTLLGATSNPLMRPIVSEYQQIAQLLAAGKGKGLSKRLAKVKSSRTRLVSRMSDVDDYLNWFEATQMKTPSDQFADYLRAATERDSTNPRRRDAISVYLDVVEHQMGN